MWCCLATHSTLPIPCCGICCTTLWYLLPRPNCDLFSGYAVTRDHNGVRLLAHGSLKVLYRLHPSRKSCLLDTKLVQRNDYTSPYTCLCHKWHFPTYTRRNISPNFKVLRRTSRYDYRS
ncbi:hypothetical protein TRVL_00737 [Trypanosoma vivax]|nr:hypothetical protein TRVL_00737 [Trypanosoma vivax]